MIYLYISGECTRSRTLLMKAVVATLVGAPKGCGWGSAGTRVGGRSC